jgi:hypothetical protein
VSLVAFVALYLPNRAEYTCLGLLWLSWLLPRAARQLKFLHQIVYFLQSKLTLLFAPFRKNNLLEQVSSS